MTSLARVLCFVLVDQSREPNALKEAAVWVHFVMKKVWYSVAAHCLRRLSLVTNYILQKLRESESFDHWYEKQRGFCNPCLLLEVQSWTVLVQFGFCFEICAHKVLAVLALKLLKQRRGGISGWFWSAQIKLLVTISFQGKHAWIRGCWIEPLIWIIKCRCIHFMMNYKFYIRNFLWRSRQHCWLLQLLISPWVRKETYPPPCGPGSQSHNLAIASGYSKQIIVIAEDRHRQHSGRLDCSSHAHLHTQASYSLCHTVSPLRGFICSNRLTF